MIILFYVPHLVKIESVYNPQLCPGMLQRSRVHLNCGGGQEMRNLVDGMMDCLAFYSLESLG